MMEVQWGRLRADQLRERAQHDAVVVLPLGAMEQHGPHLPVQVDTVLVGEIAERAALQVADRAPVVVLPTLWCSLSEHHMPFGGTVTLSFATLDALIGDVVRSVVRHGFRRIFLLNGHGGNRSAINVITDRLTIELQIPMACATYWGLAAHGTATVLEAQESIHHACEAETSMMWALHPDLVHEPAVAAAGGEIVTTASGIAGIEPAVYRWRSFPSRTETGAIGVPGAATAEKGEALLDGIAAGLAAALMDQRLWEAPI